MGDDAGRIENYLDQAVPDRESCLVISPRAVKRLTGGAPLAASTAAFLLTKFARTIVHGLRPRVYDSALVAALSGGRLQSIGTLSGSHSSYEIANDSRDICGPFAGVSFGPANPFNDGILAGERSGSAVKALISIEGRPFLASIAENGAEVLFIAGEDTADVGAQVGEAPLDAYFSRFVPQAMALRHAAADECWRPARPFATVTIDDPLLRETYGFIHFETLLELAKWHNFHAAIAFIPHNFRRDSPRIVRMFRENPERLSICFHGNDHTGAEFASRDPAQLNALLRIAEDRMRLHQNLTGIPCDRVMVFPQGRFSIEAMKALQAHNFRAAANTTEHPAGGPDRLTIGELAQPAVLRYGNFPLFLRRALDKTGSQDIAFNVFFGKPVLIVEHHDDFRHPETLAEIADRINRVAPDVRWSNLASAVGNAVLTRQTAEGEYQVRAYASAVRISNDSNVIRQYAIEWNGACDMETMESVLAGRRPCADFETDGDVLRLPAKLEPGASQEFSVIHSDGQPSVASLGLKWNARAFVRRRLSEFRDNYLSKNDRLLEAAKAFQRRALKI